MVVVVGIIVEVVVEVVVVVVAAAVVVVVVVVAVVVISNDVFVLKQYQPVPSSLYTSPVWGPQTRISGRPHVT